MRLPALQSPSLLITAAALPHVLGLSPARSTTAAPPRPDRSTVGAPSPTHPPDAGGQGKIRNGSRVHCGSLNGGGARLCPCGIAASTPQPFPAASLAAHAHRRGSSLPTHSRCAPLPAQIHQVRAGAASRGCHTPVPHVLLSIPLAGPKPSGSAGPSRRCRGCSHPHRHHPAQTAPSSTALLRQDQRRRSLTSPRTTAPHGAPTACGTVSWRSWWPRAATSGKFPNGRATTASPSR
jgi:hypothetical protein